MIKLEGEIEINGIATHGVRKHIDMPAVNGRVLELGQDFSIAIPEGVDTNAEIYLTLRLKPRANQ